MNFAEKESGTYRLTNLHGRCIWKDKKGRGSNSPREFNFAEFTFDYSAAAKDSFHDQLKLAVLGRASGVNPTDYIVDRIGFDGTPELVRDSETEQANSLA